MNKEAEGHQGYPRVRCWLTEASLAVWESEGQDGDGYGVFARRIAPDGSLPDDEFQVNSYSFSYQSRPDVAAVAGGGFAISWTSYGQDGDRNGVFARVFDGQIAAASDEIEVARITKSDQYDTSIAGLPDGTFLVSFTSDAARNGVSSTYLAHFASDGVRLGSPVAVLPRSGGDATESGAVATGEDGTILVSSSTVGTNGAQIEASSFEVALTSTLASTLRHGDASLNAILQEPLSEATASLFSEKGGEKPEERRSSDAASGISADAGVSASNKPLSQEQYLDLMRSSADQASAKMGEELAQQFAKKALNLPTGDAEAKAAAAALSGWDKFATAAGGLVELNKQYVNSSSDTPAKRALEAYLEVAAGQALGGFAGGAVTSLGIALGTVLVAVPIVGPVVGGTIIFASPIAGAGVYAAVADFTTKVVDQSGLSNLAVNLVEVLGIGAAEAFLLAKDIVDFGASLISDDELRSRLIDDYNKTASDNFKKAVEAVESVVDNALWQVNEGIKSAQEALDEASSSISAAFKEVLDEAASRARRGGEVVESLVERAIERVEQGLKRLFDDPATSSNEFDELKDALNKVLNLTKDAIGDLIKKAFNLFDGANRPIDPIVLDLDRDGIELVSVAASAARFDMDADGFAERTAWVAPDDAFLIHDRNGDGIVNDISEFFGSAGIDGFAELEGYDTNRDGAIAPDEPIWGQLKLWRDLDGDGNTDPGELTTSTLPASSAFRSTLTRCITLSPAT